MEMDPSSPTSGDPVGATTSAGVPAPGAFVSPDCPGGVPGASAAGATVSSSGAVVAFSPGAAPVILSSPGAVVAFSPGAAVSSPGAAPVVSAGAAVVKFVPYPFACFHAAKTAANQGSFTSAGPRRRWWPANDKALRALWIAEAAGAESSWVFYEVSVGLWEGGGPRGNGTLVYVLALSVVLPNSLTPHHVSQLHIARCSST